MEQERWAAMQDGPSLQARPPVEYHQRMKGIVLAAGLVFMGIVLSSIGVYVSVTDGLKGATLPAALAAALRKKPTV